MNVKACRDDIIFRIEPFHSTKSFNDSVLKVSVTKEDVIERWK